MSPDRVRCGRPLVRCVPCSPGSLGRLSPCRSPAGVGPAAPRIGAMPTVHAVAGAAPTLTPAVVASSLGRTRLAEGAGIMTYRRLGVAAGLLGATIAVALAQDLRFPTRTISIVVANAAGGGTDYLARLIGQKLQDRLGQSVIIENKPGANSMIAAQSVIRAPADGHTLLMGSIGMLTVNPAVEIGRASRR